MATRQLVHLADRQHREASGRHRADHPGLDRRARRGHPGERGPGGTTDHRHREPGARTCRTEARSPCTSTPPTGWCFGSTLSGKPTARLCNADASPTAAHVLGNTPAGTGGCLGDSDTVSSSQVPSTGRFALAISADRREAETTFVVGTGTTSGQQGPVVQCDEDHTCRLAVAVYVSINGGRGQWIVDSSAVLGFEPPDPLQGCGKPDPNAFSSVGADRLFEAWTRWTRAYCKDPAHPNGAPATATLSGEGDNLSAYEQGQADLAYAASTDPALTGGAASRPSVAVPIGLNAVVHGASAAGGPPIRRGRPATTPSTACA